MSEDWRKYLDHLRLNLDKQVEDLKVAPPNHAHLRQTSPDHPHRTNLDLFREY